MKTLPSLSRKSELKKRTISVTRDRSLLLPGDLHQEKLLREAASSDCFILLVSPDAAASAFVQAEVRRALDAYGRLVKKIVPIILSPVGGNGFPKELGEIQAWTYNGPRTTDADFDSLARNSLGRFRRQIVRLECKTPFGA